jgi:hypothetical protein
VAPTSERSSRAFQAPLKARYGHAIWPSGPHTGTLEAAEMRASNGPRIKSDWQSLCDELDSSTGRSIVQMAPDLVAAIRSSRNALEAEGRLLATLSSQKAAQHKWLTRSVLSSKSKARLPSLEWISSLPPSPERDRLREEIERRHLRAPADTTIAKLLTSAGRLERRWLDAARIPEGPERQMLYAELAGHARARGGFMVTQEEEDLIVSRLAGSAPQYEENAAARKARRQRAEMGNCRRSGRPKKSSDALAGVTDADLREVQVRAADGRWRVNSRAKRWVGYAVASALKLDAFDKKQRPRISALVEKLIKIGALIVVKTRDASRQKRSFVEVGTLADVLHHSTD